MSSTLAIHERVQMLREEGRQVFHLGFGEACFPVHPRVLAALREHATSRLYPPVAGLPRLRERVASYYARRFGIEADPSRVIVGCGSKSLLFAALAALDGDVLLPVPSWVSYETQVSLAGSKAIPVPTSAVEGYCPTPGALRRAVAAARQAGRRPAVVVLTSPNNPTGVVYPPELISELAATARAEGLVVISDEIYALCSWGEVAHRSAALDYPEATVVTGGLSKHLSLGGWRLGVAVLPGGLLGERLLRHMTAVAGSIWSAAAAPVQHAAVVAYDDDGEIDNYVEACAALHGLLTRYLYGVLEAARVPCPRPAAGFYLYPSLAPWSEALAARHGVRDSAALAETLLEGWGVVALPGSNFAAAPEELTLRLSISCLHPLGDHSAAEVMAIHDRGLSPEELAHRHCPQLVEAGRRLAAFVESLESP